MHVQGSVVKAARPDSTAMIKTEDLAAIRGAGVRSWAEDVNEVRPVRLGGQNGHRGHNGH